jgi:mannose-6-phosphate isomerase-like protein (cupin superfamily)
MQRNRISVRKFLGALAAAAVLYFGLGALLHYVVFPEEEPPAWAYGRSGFSFETPTGERFRLIHGPIETGGEFSEAHFDLLPGGHAGRPHVHPHQEERFEVLSGSLTALVGDEERVVSAGEILVVPPGTPHQPFNRGDIEMRSIARITPAGKLGLFFGQLSGLGFKPTFLQTMLFVQAYDVYPATPPPAVVRVMSFLLAPTARLVGYRSFYPEYAKRFLGSAAQQGAQLTSASRVVQYRRWGSLRSPAALAAWRRDSVVYHRGQRAPHRPRF